MEPILLDLPVPIETPRLVLRPSESGDGEQLHRAILDGYEDHVRWLARSKQPPTLLEAEKEARQHAVDWLSREFIRFVLISKANNKIIGRAGFPPILSDWRVPYFGISYFVSKSTSGQGLCTEAVNALTRYAFGVLNARKVEIKVDTENLASVRVPQKLGFQLEATQRGNWPRSDKADLAEIQTYSLFDIDSLPALDVTW